MVQKQSRELSPELQEIADYHINKVEDAAAEGVKQINEICNNANKALDDLQRKVDKWWIDAVDKHKVHTDTLVKYGQWDQYKAITKDVYGHPNKFRSEPPKEVTLKMK